jgi:DNA-binding transcriptional LysR family regulator
VKLPCVAAQESRSRAEKKAIKIFKYQQNILCWAMSIRRLKTLLMIAESGGFSAASERLFITQSAVSMQMRSLEEEWGIVLFDRSKRPPILNRQGWLLVPRAKALVDQYEALVSGARTQQLVGSLRIGVVPSAASALLPQVLLKLQHVHPGLTIRAESALSGELAFKVGQGRLDAAVITEPDHLEAGLVATHVRTEELKLFVHHKLARGTVEEMLTGRPFIQFSGTMGVGRIVDAALRARGIKVNAIVELDSIESILGMVEVLLGIAIVPEHSVRRKPRTSLRSFSLTPPVTRNLVLVTRREFAELPAIQILRETFQSATGKDGPQQSRRRLTCAVTGDPLQLRTRRR